MFRKKKELFIQEIKPSIPKTPDFIEKNTKQVPKPQIQAPKPQAPKKTYLKKREPISAFQRPMTYNILRSSFAEINKKHKNSAFSVIIPFMSYSQICSL
jgi:hypothetical protein